VEDPLFPLEGLPILDQSAFKVFPEPLHDMEVVVLEGSFGPDPMEDGSTVRNIPQFTEHHFVEKVWYRARFELATSGLSA
jgi:hypothetical protein